MSADLTFITSELGKHLSDRFGDLLGDDTRCFNCLVGYFFISGFHKLHPALTKCLNTAMWYAINRKWKSTRILIWCG